MKKALGIVAIVVVALGVAAYGTYQYKNRQHGPDLYAYYLQQDRTPVGKTAVFLIGLGTTEEFDATWWYNIYQHVAHVRIPWPFRYIALADRGVALMDPRHYYARERFEPTALEDRHGFTVDMDGTPYLERYRQGLVEWVEPMESIHLDTGYWVYTGRGDGVPTSAGKTINSARLWYYKNGTAQQKIPHRYQSRRVFELAFAELAQKYPNVPAVYSDTMDPFGWHQKVNALLDSGVETLILASPMVVYSDYEDFRNGFLHTWEMVEEWEAANGRPIKVIIAPPTGHSRPIREGYLLMLKDKLDTLPDGASVKMVWSIHGMPWRAFPNESWLKMAPAYRDVLVEDTENLLRNNTKEILTGATEELFRQYNFSRTEVVVSQDHFADKYWDPEKKSLSTNRAYREGIRDGFDHVLNLPIEFYTENTDTLFYHAMVNYEGFPGYSPTDKIDYPDWDKPYTRHFEIDGTQIDYLGVPTGDRYRPYVAKAMFQAWDSVLSRGDTTVLSRAGDPTLTR